MHQDTTTSPTPPNAKDAKREKAKSPVRFDKHGTVLIKLGTRFRAPLYQEYRRIAFYRGLHVYELINDAMEAYLPELKKGTHQRLTEAGQGELDL